MFLETLRFWPAAVAIDRECVKPFELPPVDDTKTQGYTVAIQHITHEYLSN